VLVGSNLPPDKVRFNCRVTIRHLANGKVQQFRLVGPVEADAVNGRLSTASPLGRALLGRAKGERVDLDTPAGRRSYQILDISVDEA
jgi:transcription elongation factor GreA